MDPVNKLANSLVFLLNLFNTRQGYQLLNRFLLNCHLLCVSLVSVERSKWFKHGYLSRIIERLYGSHTWITVQGMYEIRKILQDTGKIKTLVRLVQCRNVDSAIDIAYIMECPGSLVGSVLDH